MKNFLKECDKLVLVSFVISLVVMVHSFNYWMGATGDFSGTLGFIFVLPNLIFLTIGFILNSIALFKENKWLIFTAGLMYSIAILLFLPYVVFSIAQSIMCFISFSKKCK